MLENLRKPSALQNGRFGFSERHIIQQVNCSFDTDGHGGNHKLQMSFGMSKVPSKQPKRGRLWLNDGSCVRLRRTHPNHVWSYDFLQDCTQRHAVSYLEHY